MGEGNMKKIILAVVTLSLLISPTALAKGKFTVGEIVRVEVYTGTFVWQKEYRKAKVVSKEVGNAYLVRYCDRWNDSRECTKRKVKEYHSLNIWSIR